MWMVDMIVFGVLYASLVVLILSPILFLLVYLVDYIIEDITDRVDYLYDNYYVPLMKKFGFEFDDYYLLTQNNVTKVVLIIFSCILCIFSCVILGVVYLMKGMPPYEVLSFIVVKITPYCTWIIIPVVYLMLRGILRKGYILIKKVNSLPETPVDKNS